jgi:hypothetical protein
MSLLAAAAAAGAGSKGNKPLASVAPRKRLGMPSSKYRLECRYPMQKLLGGQKQGKAAVQK